MKPRARHVLVIVADQLRAAHLGFGGGPMPTPALDRLAAQSTRFDRAFVTNPTCMPNRASLMTGRWPSSHGTRTNGITLDPDTTTFVRAMRNDGWRTAAVGKLHFQTMGWPYDAQQVGEMQARNPEALDTEMPDAAVRCRPEGWDRWEDAARHHDAFVPLPRDYYGFNSVDLVVGHGDAPGGHYRHWALSRGLDPDTVRQGADAETDHAGWDQVYRSEVPAALHPSAYVTDRAVDRMKELAASGERFLLFVSYPDPHHPFAPPAEYWDAVDPESVELPASFGDTHERSPEHLRRLAAHRGQPSADPTMTWAPTAEQYRHAMAAELGLIAMLDDHVGTILSSLDELGIADEVAVVFTADHGDMFGDHGLMLKHFVHYEAVTRVPLLVRLPDAEPGRSQALVSSADIAPTVLDVVGLPHHRNIQGRTLLGIVDDLTDQVRNRLLVEEDQPFGLPGLPGPVRLRTLITERARLTHYASCPPQRELYDLSADPDELHNLADDPAAHPLQMEMYTELAEELIDLADTGVRPIASA